MPHAPPPPLPHPPPTRPPKEVNRIVLSVSHAFLLSKEGWGRTGFFCGSDRRVRVQGARGSGLASLCYTLIRPAQLFAAPRPPFLGPHPTLHNCIFSNTDLPRVHVLYTVSHSSHSLTHPPLGTISDPQIKQQPEYSCGVASGKARAKLAALPPLVTAVSCVPSLEGLDEGKEESDGEGGGSQYFDSMLPVADCPSPRAPFFLRPTARGNGSAGATRGGWAR